MFWLKKSLAPLFLPVGLFVFSGLLGLFLAVRGKRRTLGLFLLACSVALSTAAGYGLFFEDALYRLERRNAALVAPENIEDRGIRWIVVLGGGVHADPDLPALSRLPLSALARVAEGVRLARVLKESRVVFSGGAVFGETAEAPVMAEAAVSLGLDRDRTALETESRDTKDQALRIKRIVGGDPFVLVTSAYHMPRALRLFRKQGMEPVPAPCGHLASKSGGFHPGSLYPSASRIEHAEKWVRERLGILWAKLRGRA
jgi:uncharacterized SAM-binding protein YcdF (DUF218 family)